jgi:hypothetical protein
MIEADYQGQKVRVNYVHMSQSYVKTGDAVQIGSQIGITGSTGTPAAHLHLEVRKNYTGTSAVGRTSCSGGCYTAQQVADITINPALVVGSGSTPAPVANYDGQNPNTTGCDRDATTVAYKYVTGGKVELRWSNTCKTNWSLVTPNSSYASTSATVTRSSDGRSYSYSGTGRIWSSMVYSPSVTSCAYGVISGISSGSGACR